MHYTVKTLLSQGKSQRYISQTLGINRRTVKRIADRLQQGQLEPSPIERPVKLADYSKVIQGWIEHEGLSASLIRQRLQELGLTVSHVTVWRFIKGYTSKEVYVPVVALPGTEAQVDFGYMGYFDKDGKRVKVWVFCMVLSHSRYAYYREVTDQSIATFLRCHMEAYSFFGGVPATTKIDNLKAGVLQADFYQPTIQHQYAQMLSHYGSAPITARIRRGQDKGKVEAGIKYVKGNFLKGLRHRDYYRMSRDLQHWNKEVCNKRVHGTTRKVPQAVYEQIECTTLQPLPATRFELMDISHRRVNRLSHIYYGYNFYSVPYQYCDRKLRVESNGTSLRIYDGRKMVAMHAITTGRGNYITVESHKPPCKQTKSREYYSEQMTVIGPHAFAVMEQIQQQNSHWKDMIRGILHLSHIYEAKIVEAACRRALTYRCCTYLSIKRICESGLYIEPVVSSDGNYQPGGHGHELELYDSLFSF